MARNQDLARLHVTGRHEHAITDENGFYVVSDSTLDEAARAGKLVALEDFGDLRRLGNLEELSERLQERDLTLTLAGYVEAIEKAGGITPSEADLAARLSSLANVLFNGFSSPDGDYPADRDDFRAESERDAEWEDPEAQVIAQATYDDLPDRFRERFCVSSYDMFGTLSDVFVPESLISELVAALRQDGFDVIDDD